MSIIPSLPVTLQNGTTADATQVMANFNSIVTNVNNNAANNGINSNITQLLGLTTPLSTAQGGTGVVSPTAHGVLIGEGASAVSSVGPGTAGQALISGGAGADPSYQNLPQFMVGDLYITTVSTNPATRLGYGTWAPYAAGQVLIGVGSFTDGDGTAETISGGQQLGEYLHTLTTGEMPAHSHPDSGHTHGSLNTNFFGSIGGASQTVAGGTGSFQSTTATGYANIQNTGGGAAHNNIQPSIGVYIWLRTA